MIAVQSANAYSGWLSSSAWMVGVAYWHWLSSSPINAPWWAVLLVILVGSYFASIAVTGMMTVLAGLITKAITGSSHGSPYAFAWAAFISPVLAFVASRWGLLVFSGL